MGESHVRSHTQRQGEISYIAHPRVWGQGIGTGIGRQLLSRGFGQLRLHRIFATLTRGMSAPPECSPSLA
ncbi:GNAT family protein [Streptomyces sp. NPDC006872]|uniref:GNAT family N-acetyltransferase n=1 Tax=Streptomyces sp. NPDC006872 TaxID=3155720 RepID=UPI0033CE923D